MTKINIICISLKSGLRQIEFEKIWYLYLYLKPERWIISYRWHFGNLITNGYHTIAPTVLHRKQRTVGSIIW